MHVIELTNIASERYSFFFEDEACSKRCLDSYAKNAQRAASAVGATATVTEEKVDFSWDGPVGIIHWSAAKRVVDTDDHKWQ